MLKKYNYNEGKLIIDSVNDYTWRRIEPTLDKNGTDYEMQEDGSIIIDLAVYDKALQNVMTKDIKINWNLPIKGMEVLPLNELTYVSHEYRGEIKITETEAEKFNNGDIDINYFIKEYKINLFETRLPLYDDSQVQGYELSIKENNGK